MAGSVFLKLSKLIFLFKYFFFLSKKHLHLIFKFGSFGALIIFKNDFVLQFYFLFHFCFYVFSIFTITAMGHRTNDSLFASEAVIQRCSVKKMFIEISQNSQENTCTRVSFFHKVAGLSLQIY